MKIKRKIRKERKKERKKETKIGGNKRAEQMSQKSNEGINNESG